MCNNGELDAAMVCNNCKTSFASRNKLFKHLQQCLLASDEQSLKRLRGSECSTIVVDAGLVDFEMYDVYIYVLGGRIRGKTLGTVERFHINKQLWELCPSMIENRGSHCAAVLDQNELYAIAGGGFHSNLSSCEMLNLSTNTWKLISTMKSCRHALSSTVLNNKIYVIGGWENGSRCSDIVEVYNKITNEWSLCTPLPTPRRLIGCTSFDHLIYTFGGQVNDPDFINMKGKKKDWVSDVVEVYDTVTNTWRMTLQKMPCAGCVGAVTIDRSIFVFVHGQNAYHYQPETDIYTLLSTLPQPEWYCFDVVAVGSVAYLVGGVSQGNWGRGSFSYHTNTGVWEPLPLMNKCRRRCAAAVVMIPKAITALLSTNTNIVTTTTSEVTSSSSMVGPDLSNVTTSS